MARQSWLNLLVLAVLSLFLVTKALAFRRLLLLFLLFLLLLLLGQQRALFEQQLLKERCWWWWWWQWQLWGRKRSISSKLFPPSFPHFPQLIYSLCLSLPFLFLFPFQVFFFLFFQLKFTYFCYYSITITIMIKTTRPSRWMLNAVETVLHLSTERKKK